MTKWNILRVAISAKAEIRHIMCCAPIKTNHREHRDKQRNIGLVAKVLGLVIP